MSEQCQGTTASGDRCRKSATDPDGLCDFHTEDPERRAAWQEKFHARGGKAAQARLPVPDAPTTPEEVRDFLAWAMRAVARGQIKEGVLRQLRETAELWFAADGAVEQLKRRKEA